MRSHRAILRKLVEGGLDTKVAYIAGKNGKLVPKNAIKEALVFIEAKPAVVVEDQHVETVKEEVFPVEQELEVKEAAVPVVEENVQEPVVALVVEPTVETVEEPVAEPVVEVEVPKKKLQLALKKKKFTE